MKCWRCGKEISDNDKTCEYCGAFQKRKNPVSETGKAMRSLADRYGAEELFHNKTLLINGLSDLVKDSKNLRNQISTAMDTEMSYLYLKQMKKGSSDQDFEKRVFQQLTENAGLSDKTAKEIIGYFDEMIGWDSPGGKYLVNEKSAGEATVQNNDTKYAGGARGNDRTIISGDDHRGYSNKPKKTGLFIAVALIAAAVLGIVLFFSGGKSSRPQPAPSAVTAKPEPTKTAETENTASENSEDGSVPVQQNKIIVHRGNIYASDDTARKNSLGTEIEYVPGNRYRLKPDPDEYGYYFKEWKVISGSLPESTDLSKESLSLTPAEGVIELEAVYEEWVLYDWIDVLDGLDDLFTYSGKHLLELEESDLKAVYEKAGIQCYTKDNGSFFRDLRENEWWAASYERYSLANVSYAYTPKETVKVHAQWIDRGLEDPIDPINSLLPDSCPIKIGDTLDQVLEQLGITDEMMGKLQEINGTTDCMYFGSESRHRYWINIDDTSDYYYLHLKNLNYDYSIAFYKPESYKLSRISIEADYQSYAWEQ